MAYQLLLSKAHAVAHVAPAMTAADSVWAEEVQHKLLGTRVTLNPARPDYGANEGVITGEHVELTFKTLLVGSGTAGVAPSWGMFGKSSGWTEDVEADESVTYTRGAITDASPTQAFDWSDEGRRHKVLDARGFGSIDLTPGQPPRINWTYRGILVPVTSRALVTAADADFSDWPTVRPISHDLTTFTLGGVNSMALRGLTMNGADNVKFVDLPNQKGVFHRGDPSFSGSLKADVPAGLAWNPEAKWIAGAKEAFTATHGTTAGQIVTVNGVAQFDAPAWSKEDEVDVFTSNIFLTTAPSIVLT